MTLEQSGYTMAISFRLNGKRNRHAQRWTLRSPAPPDPQSAIEIADWEDSKGVVAQVESKKTPRSSSRQDIF
jgi:hypothetical protein